MGSPPRALQYFMSLIDSSEKQTEITSPLQHTGEYEATGISDITRLVSTTGET